MKTILPAKKAIFLAIFTKDASLSVNLTIPSPFFGNSECQQMQNIYENSYIYDYNLFFVTWSRENKHAFCLCNLMLQQQTKTGEKEKKKHCHNWQKDRISQVR